MSGRQRGDPVRSGTNWKNVRGRCSRRTAQAREGGCGAVTGGAVTGGAAVRTAGDDQTTRHAVQRTRGLNGKTVT